jgi:D-3-phosphoglycerate dehydrogenase / 2-oxoglutarate reductase
MEKILISDPLSEEGVNILKKVKKFQIDEKFDLSPDELKKEIKKYDALIIRSGTQVTKDIVANAKKLKVIGRAGIGVDNIDVEAASLRGIVVMNAPGGNTISTAEHTFSLILALSRNIPQANASLKLNKWDRKKFMGTQLFGKTIGIIGMGRIGTEVAKRALSFGMKVVAFDPYMSEEKLKDLKVEVASFNTLLAKADYITVHTPKTEETTHMIGKDEFKKMKKGVRIINCARGGIIDEKSLLEAIKKGRVAGAALDVYEGKSPADNPLIKLDNVVATPHLGASTEEAQVSVAIDIANQVKDALLNKVYKNAVNIPTVEKEILNEVEPYIALTEKIGKLQSQLLTGRIKQIRIKYSGEVSKYPISPITGGLIKGLLSPILEEPVNDVNAQFIAKERGINIIESKHSETEEFSNLISVKIQTDKEKSEVAGTLFTKQDPRIVKIDEFYVDAIPSGYMIITKNKDLPGIVGQIGTILGRNKINISAMTFGRKKPGGQAITVLNIDTAVSRDLIRKIKSAKNIIDAKLIKL